MIDTMVCTVERIIMNEPNWFDWGQFGVSILQILISCATLYFAYSALSTWKKEFLGKKEIELAEDVVIKMGVLKDILEQVRNGFSFKGETEEIEQELSQQTEKGKTQEIHKERLFYLVPILRLQKSNQDIQNFMELEYKAEVYWSDSYANLFDEVKSIIINIRSASKNLYGDHAGSKKEEYENMIWIKPDDPISKKIDDIYNEFKLNWAHLSGNKSIKEGFK